jgi:hypothetical protein
MTYSSRILVVKIEPLSIFIDMNRLAGALLQLDSPALLRGQKKILTREIFEARLAI